MSYIYYHKYLKMWFTEEKKVLLYGWGNSRKYFRKGILVCKLKRK